MSIASALVALTLRDLSTNSGTTINGLLWSIISPLGVILLLSLASTAFSETPPLGGSFPLFFASGYLILDLFLNISGKTQSAIQNVKVLLSYPRLTWIDPILSALFLATITQVLIATLVLWLFRSFDKANTLSMDYFTLFTVFFTTITLGFGVGVFNAGTTLYFPIWDRLWSIACRVLFFTTGIFFLPDAIEPELKGVISINPLFQLVELMRHAIYPNYFPYNIKLYWPTYVGLLLLLAGLIILKNGHYRVTRR